MRTAIRRLDFVLILLLTACSSPRSDAPAPDRPEAGSGGRAPTGVGGQGGSASSAGEGGSAADAGSVVPTDGPAGACAVGETRCTTTGPAAVEVCAAGGVWT